MFKWATMHALLVLIVAAIIAEFSKGLLRQIMWTVAALVAVAGAYKAWMGG